MASSDELEPTVPTVLPADFNEWDNNAAPAAEREKKSANDAAKVGLPTLPSKRSQTVSPDSRTKRQAGNETLFQSVTAEVKNEETEAASLQEDRPSKRGIYIAAGVLAVLLLVVLFLYPGYLKRGPGGDAPSSAHAEPMQTLSAPTSAPQDAPTTTEESAAPAESTPSSQSAAPATPATTASPEAAEMPRVPQQMMKAQLNAPRRIPKDLVNTSTKEAAPAANFGSVSIEGMNSGTNANRIFTSTGSKSKVVTLGQVSLSGNEAMKLVVKKTPPVYPNIAKTERVSGTVTLQGVVSKTGTLQDLRILGGPQLLRTPVLDAVKHWKFHSYQINNQPVDAKILLSFNFSL
jgi:protein TonB